MLLEEFKKIDPELRARGYDIYPLSGASKWFSRDGMSESQGYAILFRLQTDSDAFSNDEIDVSVSAIAENGQIMNFRFKWIDGSSVDDVERLASSFYSWLSVMDENMGRKEKDEKPREVVRSEVTVGGEKVPVAFCERTEREFEVLRSKPFSQYESSSLTDVICLLESAAKVACEIDGTENRITREWLLSTLTLTEMLDAGKTLLDMIYVENP